MNKFLLPLMALAAMETLKMFPDKLKNIDIEKEYKLIQKKKSHLSRRLREMVVYRYEQKQKGEL